MCVNVCVDVAYLPTSLVIHSEGLSVTAAYWLATPRLLIGLTDWSIELTPWMAALAFGIRNKGGPIGLAGSSLER